MTVGDPVIERIVAHPWPRGGVEARRVRGVYTLTSARTGAPVARLKPLLSGDRLGVATPGDLPGRSALFCRSTMRSHSSLPNQHSGSGPNLSIP